MNVLFVIGLSIGLAFVIGLNRFNAIQTVHNENERLRQEARVLQMEADELSRAWTNVESRLSSGRESLHEVRNELAELAREANEAVTASPETEGAWPQSKGYFYLAKEYLDDVGYRPFTDAFELNTHAIRLFGLTPEEERAVSQACLNFRKQVDDLRFGASERIEPAPGVNNATHQEVQYKVGARTNEFHAIRLEFENELRRSMGDTRADLFLKRASPDVSQQAFGQFGASESYVSYVADIGGDGKVTHRVKIETPDRGTMYSLPVEFPVKPGTQLWKYRQLFGDQPLIPLPPEQDGGTK